jgi:hypothetical protein
MMKDYNNKKKAGQTGKWADLFYDGRESTDGFVGNWWYKDFAGDSKYSGKFTMRKVKTD